MRLVVLGSGTSVPHPARASAAFWLESDKGSLLLDVSADAPHRMAQEKLDWPSLDSIWVSHFHLDHLGGLAPFLFGMKWAPQTRDRHKPLNIFGPPQLKDLIEAFSNANNYDLLKQTFEISIIEVAPGEEFEILPQLKTVTFHTPHTSESLAIRLTDNRERSLVYTSDTGYSDQLIDFARGATLLLMECSFRKDKPIETHLELADAMQFARACGPHKLVLTHLYPEWDDFDLVAEAKSLWPGVTIAATDGLQLDF